MKKHCIFFTKNTLPKPGMASAIQFVNSANAAANIGYPAVLVYLDESRRSYNPVNWIYPYRLEPPKKSLMDFYNVQDRLKTVTLPNPWPIDKLGKNRISSAMLSKRYFLPFGVLPHAKLFYVRDWNFAKMAVERKVPCVLEWHFPCNDSFNPEIVNDRSFKITVVVSTYVKNDVIKHGMPPEKILQVHSGVNQVFFTRDHVKIQKWRGKLLNGKCQYLAVYSGGLYKFKGIDLLIEVSTKLPQIHFLLAGGEKPQIKKYQKLAEAKKATNITFLGYVSHSELVGLLKAADILLHPHLLGEASTFTSPLKFFEYMASGTPVVATEILPLMEFKDLSLAMVWCKPDDPVLLSGCIENALKMFPRKEMGYRENVEFARQFTWEKRMERIFERADIQHEA
jgi:glycosyltransferase involved in cell wall biosynthesis